MKQKRSYRKLFWGLAIAIVGAAAGFGGWAVWHLGMFEYPACPQDLSGILTAPLVDPKYIAGMTPLGNVTPPGHTYPIDHNYFAFNTTEKVPAYAPADSWITHIMVNSTKKTTDSPYVFDSIVVTYTVCRTLILDFAGYTDLVQPIQDELAKHPNACRSGIVKAGHENAGEQQCDYTFLDIPVKSNQLIGYTQDIHPGFEIWAADYGKPARSDVDWTYYDDNRYAHAICTFDLYSGALKDQFYAKLGLWMDEGKRDAGGKRVAVSGLIPRTVEPICGQIVQDVRDTAQGAWFSHKPDPNDKSGNVADQGQGLSLIHNNFDATQAEVVFGGELGINVVGAMEFMPAHSGTINREPGEVKADGQTYCYDAPVGTVAGSKPVEGKLLIRLVDDHHLEADWQSGTCGANEAIQTVYSFSR